MTNRVQRLVQSVQVDRYPICIAKLRIACEVYAATDGEPMLLRRAKTLAAVLEQIPIFIEEDELIVGQGASKPMGLEIDPEYGIWTQDEVDALKGDGFAIDPEDERELQLLNAGLRPKTLIEGIGEIVAGHSRLWPFMLSGVVLPPWKSAQHGSGGGYAQSGLGLGPGFFLMCVDFPRVLKSGLRAIVGEAEQALKNLRYDSADCLKRATYLHAVVLVHRAAIAFAHRYAALAESMAGAEPRQERRRELERIAATCRHVPEHPARTFYEALQSFWFVFLMITPSPTAAAGRFDQYMYPFYRGDMDAGRTTDEEVLELLECLRLKDMQLNRTSGKNNRKKNAGMAKWHNWTIGGVTLDGRDATNELTYLLLEAARETATPHHTLTLRVHDGTPQALLMKALEVARTGIGMPAFIGDRSYIEFFTPYGVSEEQAREYVMTGCLDANLPGKSRVTAIGMFIVPLVFDIFRHNGVDPNTGIEAGLRTGDWENFATYEEFYAAFLRQLQHFMELAAEKDNIELLVSRELFPDPFRASLMEDGIACGRDTLDRQMPFENGAVLNPVGMINVADSLAAIRQLVFDERKISMRRLQDALAANWEGFDDVRKRCLAAPKYGNGDDRVDSIARDLYAYWVKTARELPTAFGSTHKATAISITSHQPGGALTGATPDGRCAREICADGTVSPMQGRDTHGPTSVLRSALKIDQGPYQATLMNLKFHPTALANPSDLEKLSLLLRTYFKCGGKHVQFNVVTRETLLAAQEQPENYRNLVVRVAGYSAYFAQLNRPLQDEVIARTEHCLQT
jgi:pyruvate formate-lyase/glycerol dehydratase family glycyl radical enzyme